MMPFSLEVQHRVDDVLECLGTSETAFFRHVSHKKRRNVVTLRGKQKLGRRLTYLSDTAGRRLKLQREHRLNGVDDEKLRADAADLFENRLDAGLGEQVKRGIAHAQALAARFNL